MLNARAYIFDFYATLVEDDVGVLPMWEYLTQLGYHCTPELQAVFEPDAFDGTLTPNYRSDPCHDAWMAGNWSTLLRLSGVPAHEISSVLGEFVAYQRRFRAKPVRAAASTICFLRTLPIKVGLCSNWECPIEPYLAQCGLPPFDAISISFEVGARKPHLAIFQDICSKLDVLPHEAVFVGDNWATDIVGALRANLLPVWIRNGRETKNLRHLVAEVDSLSDFHSQIRALFS